jgi:O-antigen/teichoic acid export membrane protein
MQQPSLLKASLKAGIWTLAGHGSSQALRLASNLLLTRLLAPEAFGTMSVATVILVGVVMFSDLGLRQVIVRSKEASDPTFLNTVWTLQVLQGVGVAAVLLLIAAGLALAQHQGVVPPGSTYAATELPLLVAGFSVGAMIFGLESTKLASAEKEMLLRPVVFLELASQALGLVAMCAVAAVYPTVYVLLIGALVTGASKTAASHLLPIATRNRLQWSWPVVRQVCHISSWIVVSSALTFISGNVDKLLLAWLLGSHAMGQFAIASLLVGAANDVVVRLSSRVAFPAITKAYERNNAALARSYYRFRTPTDAFCLLLAAFLFWFGPDVVRILYDDRYAEAGTILGILGIVLIGSRYSVVPYVYLLLGRPALMAAEQGIRLAGLLVAIAVGYQLAGTRGAIWGVAVGQLAGSMAGLLVFQPRLGFLSVRRELVSIAVFAGIFGLFGYASH